MAVSGAISVQSGSAAAQSLTSTANVALVNPGDQVTVTLTTTTGVVNWSVQTDSADFYGLRGVAYQCAGQGPFSFTFAAPLAPFQLNLRSEAQDGNNVSTFNAIVKGTALVTSGMMHQARVATVAALATYVASGGALTASANGALTIDGVTMAAGDRVLLIAGAAGADNGLYTVTSPGGASAKYILTRAPDWATGSKVQGGAIVEVSEGTVYAQTTWKLTTSGTSTVDTTSVAFYPRVVTQSVTLVAGTVTVANVPILSATKTQVVASRTTAGTTTSTVSYQPIGGLTAGGIGTGTFNMQAAVAAGTINASDVSVLNVSVINW